MIKSSKIAISLPKDNLIRMERVRKALGLQRSAAIAMAVRFWLDSMEKTNLIKQYEEGYRKKPESLDEIKAMENASADAFAEEEGK